MQFYIIRLAINDTVFYLRCKDHFCIGVSNASYYSIPQGFTQQKFLSDTMSIVVSPSCDFRITGVSKSFRIVSSEEGRQREYEEYCRSWRGRGPGPGSHVTHIHPHCTGQNPVTWSQLSREEAGKLG